MGSQPEFDLSLAGLLHDLNNVLHTILQAAEPISLDARHADAAGVILRSVEHGRRLLKNTGAQNRIPLSETVDNALAFVRDHGAAGGRLPRFVVDANAPLLAHTVSAELERAFVNLLMNAAALSTDSHRPCTEVRIELQRDARDIVITVSDNGPGIPELWLQGFSGHPQDRGLGLCVARSAVQRCGGSIAAANLADGGAAFTIRVPVI